MPGVVKKQNKFGGSVKNTPRPRSGSSSSRGRERKKGKMSASEIKSALMKQADQKCKIMRGSLMNLTHNTSYAITKNLYTGILSGTSNQSRLGEDIYVNRIRMRFVVTDENDPRNTLSNRGPAKYRIVTYACNKLYEGAVPLLAASNQIINSPFSDQNGPAGNHFLSSIDQDMVKVLDDTVIAADINCGFTRQFEINVPINRKITYSAADQVYGQNNVCIYICPYLDVTDWESMADVAVKAIEMELSVFFKDFD